MTNQRRFAVMAVVAMVLANGCVATVEPVEEADCPQICPALYSPVCGDNGRIVKEFSNACEMKASNCRLQRSELATYKATDMAWCSSTLVDNLIDKLGNLDLAQGGCMKACTMLYQPLCVGNDKVRATLSNACLLENFNCALKHRNGADVSELLRVLREGEC